MILLDIQKALDSVNHNILCKKLKALCVVSTQWFESYLSHRYQIVNVNVFNHPSGHLWGSTRQYSGPSPFLWYVNDMPMSVDCNMLQYADDSALMVSDTCLGKIAELLSKNLEKCNHDSLIILSCPFTWVRRNLFLLVLNAKWNSMMTTQ